MEKVILFLLVATLVVSDSTVQSFEAEHSLQQKMLEDQRRQTSLIEINYDHIQTYATILRPSISEDFSLASAQDHNIRGAITAYISKDGTYAQTTYVPGEEIYLQVLEDEQRIIVHKQCYYQLSFQFFARKGHKYSLKFITANSQKSIIFVLQNFVSQGQVAEVLKTEHAGQHANRTKTIKEHLISYLDVIERHSLFADRIVNQIQSQTSKFLAYQWVEMLIVLAAAVVQVYLVRNMLNRNSII